MSELRTPTRAPAETWTKVPFEKIEAKLLHEETENQSMPNRLTWSIPQQILSNQAPTAPIVQVEIVLNS